jgi:acetyl esterase/lipase
MKVFLVSLVLGSAAMAVDTPPPVPAEPAREPAHPQEILLWPNGAPGSEARKDEAERTDWRQEPDIVFPVTFNIHHPSITPYLPSGDRATGAAVIIAPGGGHMFLTMDREGYDLGRWLADHGVAAFVLKYRLARDRAGGSTYRVDVEALADAQRAIRLVRSRAVGWGVDPRRIGILGFSAGGQIAALAATRFDSGTASAADPVDRESSRPDFQALIYPGPPQGPLAFSKETPPAFLLCAFDDNLAIPLANGFLALKAAGVPAEMHIYSRGGHGFGVRDRPLPVSAWPLRFREWLGDLGFLGKP